MLKLIITLLLLSLCSCFPLKNKDNINDLKGLQEHVVDGCDYFTYKTFDDNIELTHKGNCRRCLYNDCRQLEEAYNRLSKAYDSVCTTYRSTTHFTGSPKLYARVNTNETWHEWPRLKLMYYE